MLGVLIGTAISVEDVNNKASSWTDKVGDQVAHESLTVVDNGFSQKGLLRAVVDDEGVPTHYTLTIEDGILQSYIFDSYNVKQLDFESSGNGLRQFWELMVHSMLSRDASQRY